MIPVVVLLSAIGIDGNSKQKFLLVDQYPVLRQCTTHAGSTQIRVLRIVHYLLPALFIFRQGLRYYINWFTSCRFSVNHLLVHMAASHVFHVQCYQITDNGITCDYRVRVRCGAVTSLLLVCVGIRFDLQRLGFYIQ